MKIYKCDKCRKELLNYDRNRLTIREWDNTRDRIDLCNDCFRKFDNFIYGEGGKQ